MQNRYIFVNANDAALSSGSPVLAAGGHGWAFPTTGNPKIEFYVPIKGAHTAIASITMKVYAGNTLTGDPVFSLETTRYRNGVIRASNAPANVTIPAVHSGGFSYDVPLTSSLFSGVSVQE